MTNYQEIWQTTVQKLNEYQKNIEKSPQWKNILQTWQNLSRREQYLVAGASVLVGVTLIYQLIISPLNTAIENNKINVIKDQELLIYMEAAVPHIQAGKGEIQPTKTITTQEFLPTIENTLKQKDLLDKNVSQLGIVENDIVHVQFNEVDFSLLMTWLVELRKEYGISIVQFNANPSSSPGIVNADLRLSRPIE